MSRRGWAFQGGVIIISAACISRYQPSLHPFLLFRPFLCFFSPKNREQRRKSLSRCCFVFSLPVVCFLSHILPPSPPSRPRLLLQTRGDARLPTPFSQAFYSSLRPCGLETRGIRRSMQEPNAKPVLRKLNQLNKYVCLSGQAGGRRRGGRHILSFLFASCLMPVILRLQHARPAERKHEA